MKLAIVMGCVWGLATPAFAANCPIGNPDVARCDQKTLHDIGAEPATETNPQDQKMVAYRPSQPAANARLVIVLHGHPGPATTAFSQFQTLAAELGMYSIALDADFTGNTTATTADTCGPNKASGVACSNSPQLICGCYPGCYGALDALINGGFTEVGLPDPATLDTATGQRRYLPVKLRLRSYLNWLAAQPGGAAWGQFLTASGDLKWSRIVGAGLSRGSSLIGELASNNPMERALMFSGPVEHTGGTSVADQPGAGTTPTMYHWGNAHNFGACTMQAGSPTWVTDNAFAGNDGKPWATTNLYSLSDRRDARWVINESSGTDGTLRNLVALGLGKMHDPGANDGILIVGSWNAPSLTFNGHHGLVSNEICDNSAGDGGHVETLADGCHDTASNAYRRTLWTFMLTH